MCKHTIGVHRIWCVGHTTIFTACSSPEVAASVKNCSDVVVDLKGNVGSLEYRSQDSSMWTAVVPFETSADTVTIPGRECTCTSLW